MCSCLKQLPHGFADRAGAVCKKGGGGREGRGGGSRTHASLPEQEVGILLQGSRSPSPASELLPSPQEAPGTSPPEPRTRLGPARTPQSHDPAPTAGAVGHRCG